jgi:hypothetical protein
MLINTQWPNSDVVQGLGIMKVPEQREQRDLELSGQQASIERDMKALVVAQQPSSMQHSFRGLVDEAARIETEITELKAALATPLSERLQTLIVAKVAHLRNIMSDEIEQLEAGSIRRLSKLKADQEAAAKVYTNLFLAVCQHA